MSYFSFVLILNSQYENAHISIFFFMSLSETIAQNFIGNWQGQVQGSGGALQAEMSISSAGNNQIVGQLHVHSGANLESYELKCTVNTNNASGTLSYKDGTVFGLEMTWQNNTIQQQISYNNQVILQGSFSKKQIQSLLHLQNLMDYFVTPILLVHGRTTKITRQTVGSMAGVVLPSFSMPMER
jgi:hypothetical protein